MANASREGRTSPVATPQKRPGESSGEPELQTGRARWTVRSTLLFSGSIALALWAAIVAVVWAVLR
jgi:hypothetical protein